MKDSKQSLDELFSDYKEFILREYPISATYDGDHRYDDKLTDYSEKAIKARFDSVRVFFERAKEIDASEITPQLLRELEMLEPFGMGNEKPLFKIRGVRLDSYDIMKEAHFR